MILYFKKIMQLYLYICSFSIIVTKLLICNLALSIMVIVMQYTYDKCTCLTSLMEHPCGDDTITVALG